MRNLFLLFGFVLLTVSSCNCGCENRMNAVHFLLHSMRTAPLPVDLPKSENHVPMNENILEIGITPEGLYFTNKEPDKLLTFEKLEALLSKESADGSVKISGDRNANYESVMQVIALCKKLELKPILAYKND